MNKIIVTSLIFYCSLPAMEQQSPKVNIKNHAQIISLIEALQRKTFGFNGTTSTDLFSFPDYMDSSTLYRIPFHNLGTAVSQIVALPIKDFFEEKLTALYKKYPRRCPELKAALMQLYNNISEENLYWYAIDNFKIYYNQQDLCPFSKNDQKRNLTAIKENRRTFFESINTNDVSLFNSLNGAPLSKKTIPPLLVGINKCILLIEKKGQPVVDSPENSDDDNMPEISETQKNDVSEIIARLQLLNQGN